MDKKLIAERFTKAAATYTKEAHVQHRIAQRMVDLLSEHLPFPAKKIVEFGCGTGSYSRLLIDKFQPDELLLNDLCSKMLMHCSDLIKPNVEFVEGDAEQISFPQRRDLITSCSTLQWFDNPPNFFVRCTHF